MEELDNLKIENQLCFPLYACSKEVIKRYKPFLDEIDLTYTQYITMMILWDKKEINVKKIGKYLFLDSGTLTPVLKKLESKGYITRTRGKQDERNLIINITDKGIKLKEKAKEIPTKIVNCIDIDKKDAIELFRILNRILSNFKD